MNKKKLIAPIIISLVIMLYYIGFTIIVIKMEHLSMLFKLLGGLVPLVFAGVILSMLIQRIKEIKSGEEDDLGQY